MDLSTFLVNVFCVVDDFVKDQRIRERGPQPIVSDSEVLTMEIVGEFLGYDEDKALYNYFRWHWQDYFPGMGRVHRTTFIRQAANLWKVKEALWQHLLGEVQADQHLFIVDSFPVPVCRFARAKRCRLFETDAAYGYDDLARQTFYGFRAHVLIQWPGVIAGVMLTPANIHDLQALDDLSIGKTGYLLGDRNYWSPQRREQLAQQGLELIAPYKSRKRDKRPWPLWLIQTRRRVETVIGQLTERFQAKTVWARDLWHLCSRWLRKILAHTLAFLLAQQQGFDSPLQFSQLVTE